MRSTVRTENGNILNDTDALANQATMALVFMFSALSFRHSDLNSIGRVSQLETINQTTFECLLAMKG